MYLYIQLQYIFVVQKQIKHINTAYLIKIDYLVIISYIHVQMSLVFFLCCDSRDLTSGSAKQNKKSYCLMMSLLFDLIDLNKTFTKKYPKDKETWRKCNFNMSDWFHAMTDWRLICIMSALLRGINIFSWAHYVVGLCIHQESYAKYVLK